IVTKIIDVVTYLAHNPAPMGWFPETVFFYHQLEPESIDPMKLIRFGSTGKEKPGVIVSEGTRLDVSAFGHDYNEEFFGKNRLVELSLWLKNNSSTAPIVTREIRLGSPVCRPSKIVCIGLNFRDHARESKMNIPKEPVIFFKSTTSLVGPNDDLVLPRNSQK